MSALESREWGATSNQQIERDTLRSTYMTNALKTTLLLGLLTGLILVIGDVLGGQQGMMIALVIAGVMNFVSYFFSDKIALAMYRAQPVTRDQLPRVYNVVERLTQRIGLPMPKIFVIPTDSPNAFAETKHTSRPDSRFIAPILPGVKTCSISDAGAVNSSK